MRVVADTNTIVSAFLWGGKPFQLLQLAASLQIVLVTTDVLIEELLAVLSRNKFSRRLEKVGTSAGEVVADYCYLAEVVAPAEIRSTILDDPDDDAVLACALGGAADYIVSGDDHLLTLKNYSGVQIVNVHDFLELSQL